MKSKIPEELPNTDSGQTLAVRIKTKRSRRVSFADTEITSVHFFNRDDDDSSETPPPNSRRRTSPRLRAKDNDDDRVVLGFFKDLGGGRDSDDSGDDNDNDERIVDPRKSFLRPMGSPSPGGSSTAGSVTSNDGDNFFGPVSASFIRPEQLFDSAGSCENYEETMDTTAFSMHYRSLVRSESGEETKTPTAVSPAFGEKTPTWIATNNPTHSGASLMEITEPRKLVSQFLGPKGKVRSTEDSNDMSIVEENPNRYDYGRISPTTEALLDFSSYQNETNHMDDQTKGGDSKLGNSASHEKSAEAASAAGVELHQENKELPKDLYERDVSKLEFATVNSGTIQNVDVKDLQSDVCAQHDSVCQHLSEGSIRENSPIEGSHQSDIDQNFDQQYASPLVGSMLSLSAKGQQSILNTPNSARYLGIISSSKHASFVSSNEAIKAVNSISSIQKSISRSRVPNPPTPISSIKEGIDELKRKLSASSSMISPLTSVMTENSKDLKSKYVSATVACLEEKLHSADLKNGEYKMLVNTDSNGIETPKNTGILASDEATNLVEGVGSPFNMTLSGTKLMQDVLISKMSPKRTLVTCGTDSTLVNDGETRLQHQKIESETFGIAQIPPRNTTILNFQLESSEELLKNGANPLLAVSSISGSTPEPSSMKRPYTRESTQSPRKVVIRRSSRLSSGQKDLWKEPSPASSMEVPTQSPLRKVSTQSSPRVEATRRSPGKEQSKSPCRRELTWSSLWNESPQISSIKDLAQKPAMKELTKSPCRLNPSNPAESDIMQSFVGKGRVSPSSSSNILDNGGCHQELHISRSPFFKQDTNISLQKRSTGIGFEDGHHTDKIPRVQRSPDVCRNENYDSEVMLCLSDKIDSEREKMEGDRSLTNWSDFLEKFSRDTKQLLSPSIDKLNLRAIDVLEDTLVHLLKARKYEILSSEIQFQKVTSCFNIRQKRIVEAKILLSKIAHERAKLQLMGINHVKLLKRTQLLSSGIQECQRLQLKYVQQQSESGRRDILQSRSDNFEGENQVVCNNISKMKQDIKALDEKIKSLRNFFHSYCNLKGEPSSTDTITLVQDHVKTRTCGRFLHQDLQLWKVDDFESRNGHHTVLLNYQGYLCQRFTFIFCPASSIFVSNELNIANIVKNYPNMDARVAFAFALNAEAARKGVGSKSLVLQETQVTHSRLSNLLDVVDELQMAQIEIVNLIETSFDCPSGIKISSLLFDFSVEVKQLDLQLCFINFNSGSKVTLTLDVTCLNRGIYPCNILPYRAQAPTGRSNNFELIWHEIKAASDNLEVGFLRILRLCRCISQVMQSKCM